MIAEFALFVFTTLGGVGAGIYVAAAAYPIDKRRIHLAVPIVALACLAIGGVALLLHLGHPERMLNAFSNPASGITQEALASTAFGLIAFVDAIVVLHKGACLRILRIIGAVAGVALCVVMGLAYYSFEPIAAWHAWQSFTLFLCSDVSLGFLLYAALSDADGMPSSFAWVSSVAAIASVASFVCEGLLFASLGLGVVPFVVASALALIGCVGAYASIARSSRDIAWAAFTCMFVAVVCARYAFYAIV